MNTLPIFYCPKVNIAVAIDGDLKHQPWMSLTPVCDLVLSNGEGTPKQRTQVLSCWDDKNLYIAFDVVDMDIRATFTQREDKVWQEEAVEFFVSPDGNLKKYYEFQFSPRNVVRDIQVDNPIGRMQGSTFNGDWVCEGLQSAVLLDGVLNNPSALSTGWSITIALPFASILPTKGRINPGDEWLINFFRVDRWPGEEFSSWSPTFIHPWEFHVPEFFGRLIFKA